MDDSNRVKTALETAKLFVLKHPNDLMAVPVIRVIDEAMTLCAQQAAKTELEVLKVALKCAADNYVAVCANYTQEPLETVKDCEVVKRWYALASDDKQLGSGE